jgi:hypothetical protein
MIVDIRPTETGFRFEVEFNELERIGVREVVGSLEPLAYRMARAMELVLKEVLG